MELVNLTPHTVVICGVEVPPSGTVARCEEKEMPIAELMVGGTMIPLVAKVFGDLAGLPPRQDGVMYIVSALAAQAAWREGRTDVVCPASLIRDAQGRVVGANALCVG